MSCVGGVVSLLFLIAALLVAGCGGAGRVADEKDREQVGPLPEPPREFRAAWIATVDNIDWPSAPGLPVAQQRAELIALLDRAAALHLNAVILQVRPATDALYASKREPWSAYLTGHQGQAPEPLYDPLAFAVAEAHARGLELHAWFNPYRAWHPTAQGDPAATHVSRTHPDWVVRYGDYLWLDPGVPAAREHTLQVILDVVRRYDVDGVHFDDYFYPYRAYADGAPFPDSASWAHAQAQGVTLSRDAWCRQNVDRLIDQLHQEIKQIRPHVKFGISPFGIWRPGYPEGTTGFDAYSELYADARKWLRQGWVDYLTPQLYYRIAQTGQPYPIMLQWWSEQNVQGRHLWPGNFTSRVASEGPRYWPAEEILGQIYVTRAHPEAQGNVHFSMRALMGNPDSLVTRLLEGPYAERALVPASPWLDDDPPARPRLAVEQGQDGPVLAMAAAEGEEVRWWVVRRRHGTQWTLDILPGSERSVVLEGSIAVAVSAVDRSGNVGPAAVLAEL